MPLRYYAYFNYSYFLYMIPALLLSMWAQIRVSSAFRKYGGVLSNRLITGADAARRILDDNGLYDVRVEPVAGRLSDYYDPRQKVIRLSSEVFGSRSVAAVGVAAHEAGHAIQHSVGYKPLRLRNSIIPVTNFGSQASYIIIIAGFFLASSPLVLAGILLFSLVVLFQFVTLPVEFNASSRALKTLEDTGILYGDEIKGARRVLSAAAMTYVAATFTAILTLLRFIAMFGNMRGSDRR